MNTISWIETQPKFSIENIKSIVLAYYELVFPTIPDNSIESQTQRRSEIVSRLLLLGGVYEWKYTTKQQRAEKRERVLAFNVD